MKEDETANWTPPYTWEERLKYNLIPVSWYMRYRAGKEWRRGEQEVRLLPFLSDKARVSLDVGANKGVYTWFMRNLASDVYAFEPNPKIYPVVKRLETRNVHVSSVALSDKSGAASFRVPRHRRGGFSNQGGSLSAVKVPDNYVGVDVETKRLDDLGIEDVGFIKIDVEGFEQEVLAGAERTISRDKPNLLIEMEEVHTKQPIETALRQVLDMGYSGLFLHNGILRPLAAFDGDRHHREAAHRQDYIFNFIFLPA